jgi:hypothetical protein
MLIRTSRSEVADPLRFVERAFLCALRSHLFPLLARRSATRWHRHRRHPWHLRKAHALKRHHRCHWIILVKTRECRRHDWESASGRVRELPWGSRRCVAVSPHPVASSTATPSARGLESALVGNIVAVILPAKAVIVCAFTVVIEWTLGVCGRHVGSV